jgi:2-dehydro-3-deoxygalactonokinase
MVVDSERFLAIDWGTTNRRAYLLTGDGEVLETCRDDRGVLAVAKDEWPAEIALLRARMGDLPVFAAGMIGSTRGWCNAPYVDCPVDPALLAQHLVWPEAGRTAIVPGVANRDAGAPDVMRGEEVQLLGAVIAGLVPRDGLLCQPGTHSKWAWMNDGRIASFRTAMTGEMFALLRTHSLLADYLDEDVVPGDEFRAGVALAGQHRLLTTLFGERAGGVLGCHSPAAISARVSGLLIGSDVNEQEFAQGTTVHILADPMLGALYGDAIRAAGGVPVIVDSHRAFAAGMASIWRACHE